MWFCNSLVSLLQFGPIRLQGVCVCVWQERVFWPTWTQQPVTCDSQHMRTTKEGGFGAVILYAGVIFPSKIQCIKNFKGGGLRVLGGV